MKDKSESGRTYDADGFKKRAACVCVKSDSENEILLITSSKNPNQWIIPGGGVEADEDWSAAAIREMEEETGVKGNLKRFLGMFDVSNVQRKHRTAVYIMKVSEELPQWEESLNIGRKRKWFSTTDAFDYLREHKPSQSLYLESLVNNDTHKSK